MNLQIVRGNILHDMKVLGQEHGLQEYEIPRGIVLTCEPWSVASGLITPTGKVKRGAVQEKFLDSIWEEIVFVQKES